MAKIKTLTWNIENWGPSSTYNDGGKTGNDNSSQLDFYISYIVNYLNPDIVSFLELNYGEASSKLRTIAEKATSIYNVKNNKNEDNLWKSYIVNSKQRGESYAVLYKKNADFTPLCKDGSTALVDATSRYIFGLATTNATGQELEWPKGQNQPDGGRAAFYAIFKTTDKATSSENAVFSFIAYHASAPSNESENGLISVSDIGVITTTSRTTPDTLIDASLISGDFNVDYVADPDAYTPIKDLPSYPATKEKTSLKATAPTTNQDDSMSYRVKGYDNIFQKVPKRNSNTGTVLDLLKFSSKYKLGGVSMQGGLYKYCQKFDPNLFIRRAYRDAELPAKNMLDAWKFVRGAISDHLPVYVTTEIKK